jgi:NAD(P)-dependent dehydrogenase (short-subunit alcohol dehydrogenase family)
MGAGSNVRQASRASHCRLCGGGGDEGGVEVTRYLAQELGLRGIAVNTIAPGAIETDFRRWRSRQPDSTSPSPRKLRWAGLGCRTISAAVASLLSKRAAD